MTLANGMGVDSAHLERRRGPWLRLPALCAVAVALRLALALVMGDQVEPLPGIHDQLSYDALARRVATGQGFSFEQDWWPLTRAGEPTAHWSFLYTGFLAAVYSVAGPQPVAARVIQAIASGILMVWGAFRLGSALFGLRAGQWAALLVAVYPYFVYYGAALMTEAFTFAAVLWLLSVAARASGRDLLRDWAILGAMLGVLGLLRQVALAPAAVVLIAVLVRRPTKAAMRGALLALLVAGALVLPVTWRNYRVFGRLVPINTNAGYAFFWANHPIHGVDFQSVLPDSGPGYIELVPRRLRPLDEAALGDALFELGLDFVTEDPTRYVRLCLSRIDDYFRFWPSSTSSPTSNLARVLSFGLALPLMAGGIVLSRARWRDCMPCYLFISGYSLIHLLSWALVRYRLPVDAVLLVFAGLALDRIAAGLAELRARGRPVAVRQAAKLDA